MRNLPKNLCILATLAGLATIAIAAASGDRLKIPVLVGQGQAVTEKLSFDIGSGSANPFIQSTSGGTMQLSSDGTHLLSVGLVTGTASTVAGTETLTNKTLTSPVVTTPAVTGGTLAALTALAIRDTSAAFDLTIGATSSSALTAGRTLTIDVGNTSPTLALLKNLTVQTGAVTLTGNSGGSTLSLNGNSGGVLGFTAAGTVTSSAALTANALVLGGGAGATPTALALGTANQIVGMNSGATAHEYKTVAVGTSGSDFAVANAANSVTFNLPDAGASARGAVTTGNQTFAGRKAAGNSHVRVHLGTDQASLASNSRIKFDTKDFDTNTEFDASGGTTCTTSANCTGRFTATHAGYYSVCWHVLVTAEANTDNATLDLRKNGSRISWAGPSNGAAAASSTHFGCDLVSLVATDFLEVFWSTASARTISSNVGDVAATYITFDEVL